MSKGFPDNHAKTSNICHVPPIQSLESTKQQSNNNNNEIIIPKHKQKKTFKNALPQASPFVRFKLAIDYFSLATTAGITNLNNRYVALSV